MLQIPYYNLHKCQPIFALKLNMMTSSNENIFRITGLMYGEFQVTGEFPAQRPVTRGFDVFFDLGLYQ